jgi:hypothetical protein
VLKGSISAIPFVGGAINEVVFEARSRLKQERLNRLFQAVAIDVAELGEGKVDRSFLATEQFSDLIEDVCLRVSRTSFERKAHRLRRVLVDAFQGKYDSNFEPMFMNILDEITEAELQVLSSLEKAFGGKRAPLTDEDERNAGRSRLQPRSVGPRRGSGQAGCAEPGWKGAASSRT